MSVAEHRWAPLQAALLMLAAALCLSIMHSLVRHVSSSLHPFEIAFFRNLFGLFAVAPLLVRSGFGALRTRQPKVHLLRGLLGVIAMLSWFYGLSIVPLAEATALSFSAVIFGALASMIILGERPRRRRWIAIGVGFIGTLIVLRPGWQAIGAGSVVILISSVCWGANLALVKQLSKTDSTISIVALVALMLTIISLPPALWVWKDPSRIDLFWLLLIGVLGTAGHFAMTNALRRAEATSILGIDFTRLIWTALIGYWVFSESPDYWTWIGGTVIFSSSLYITYREAKAKQNRAGSEP